MKFEKYIVRADINGNCVGNCVAKYSENEIIKLVHQYDQSILGETTMTAREYDDLIDSMPSGYDTLASVLDNKFNCNTLNT